MSETEPKTDDWETDAEEIARAARDRQAMRVRAAENARRVVAEDSRRQDEEFDGLLDRVVRKAEQATGLTREQMLAMPDERTMAPEPQRITREAVKGRGVPELHLEGIFDREPIECDALEAVRRFLRDPAMKFLVLAGAVGTRKSGSACWALTQTSGLYLKAKKISRLAASHDEESVNTWRQASRVGLLVLDDLSMGYFDDKGWFLSCLTELIDDRYEAKLRTIITCNLTIEDFRKRVGDVAVDRIREHGEFYVVGGSSVRG